MAEVTVIEYVGPESRGFGGKAGGFKFRVPELTFTEAEEGKPAVAQPRVLTFVVPVEVEGKPILTSITTGAPAPAAAELLGILNSRTGEPLYAKSASKAEAEPLTDVLAPAPDGVYDADTGFNISPEQADAANPKRNKKG